VRKWVFRCFMAMPDRNISTSTLVRWAWPRRASWWPVHYQRAKLAAAEIAGWLAEVLGADDRCSGVCRRNMTETWKNKSANINGLACDRRIISELP
jgi:hypothetical protein